MVVFLAWHTVRYLAADKVTRLNAATAITADRWRGVPDDPVRAISCIGDGGDRIVSGARADHVANVRRTSTTCGRELLSTKHRTQSPSIIILVPESKKSSFDRPTRTDGGLVLGQTNILVPAAPLR